MNRDSAHEVIKRFRQDLSRLVGEAATESISSSRRTQLETEIRDIIAQLDHLLEIIDPIRKPSSVFDPGDPRVVGRFIALALVAQPRHRLSDLDQWYGSGIYALYYTGTYPLYEPISNTETPIYVGKAAPQSPRARTPVEQGNRLSRRLQDHRNSIARASSTLSVDDFEYRSLVVQTGWESAAEEYLIHLFRPIWNSQTGILYGLGKHGDSARTRANRRSPWDTLHPGRTWAADESLLDARSNKQIADDLQQHFQSHPVYEDISAVLDSFVRELSQL